MRPSTFFDPHAADHGDVFVLRGPEAHHAIAVHRSAVGDTIDVVDGGGVRLRCVIDDVTGKDQVVLSVRDRIVQARGPVATTVVQPLIKDAELAVDLLTQAGVDHIVPWQSQRSVVQWRADRASKAHTKWVNAAHQAAKQSRRAWWPTVAPLATTTDVLHILERADQVLILDAESPHGIGDIGSCPRGSRVLVVGPEGGLSDTETMAFTPWPTTRIGTDVLRSAVAGAAALFALLGHSGSP